MNKLTIGIINGILISIFLWILIYYLITTAVAHDAPAGWSYDVGCCNTTDCRQVSGYASKSKVHITEVTGGYRVNKPGSAEPEFIKWNDSRVRSSKDGEYHWCSSAGLDYTDTICLYVPNRSY